MTGKWQAKVADSICDEGFGLHPLCMPDGNPYIACCKVQTTLAQAIKWSCVAMQAAYLSTSLSAVAKYDFSEADPSSSTTVGITTSI
jgi:hypothetical protein